MKLKLLLGVLICSSISFAQVPSYVPTNGLVGWWPFNGNANDESSNTNDGTVNGANLTTDRNSDANSAYNFNGTSDFIQIANDASLSFATNQISISLWVNILNYPGNATYGKIAISKQSGDGTTQSGLNVNYKSGSHGMLIKNGSGGNFGGASNPQPITLSTWTHIVYVWDGSNGYCYENGVLVNLVNSTSAAIGGNTVPLIFGKPNWSNINAEPFAGKLDDIAIFSRPLTACEISQLYLAQNLSSTSTDIISYCDSYTWIDGNTYTTSNNTSTYVLSNSYGCDSLVTLDLTMNNSSSSVLNETALDSYTLNAQTYTQSGTYTQTLTNSQGCDSTITLNLTMQFTGIDENTLNSFKFYPNPANRYITVRSESNEELVITDLIGNVVMNVKKEQEVQTIEVVHLKSGTYFIYQGNNITKFVKN